MGIRSVWQEINAERSQAFESRPRFLPSLSFPRYAFTSGTVLSDGAICGASQSARPYHHLEFNLLVDWTGDWTLDMTGLYRLAEEIRAEFVKCFHLFSGFFWGCFSSMAMLSWIIVSVSIFFWVFVSLLFQNSCFGLVLVFFSQSGWRRGDWL